jgi:hypothetical protein
MARMAVRFVDGCSTISSDNSGIHLLGQAQHTFRVRAVLALSAFNPITHEVTEESTGA